MYVRSMLSGPTASLTSMNTDNTSDDEPAEDPDDPGSEADPESEALDDEIAHDIELARPALELGRQAAEALRPVQDALASQARTYQLALEALNSSSMRAAMDAATQQKKYIQDIVSSPAMRAAAQAAAAVTQSAAPTLTIIQQLANSPAARLAAELSEAWGRIADPRGRPVERDIPGRSGHRQADRALDHQGRHHRRQDHRGGLSAGRAAELDQR